jgi:hypothetical protein
LNIDRDLHSSTIRELYKERSERSSDSEEELSELSIEIILPESGLKLVKSEKKIKMTKAQERQEARDKARAWALDRSRARKGNKMSGSKENNKNASNTQGAQNSNRSKSKKFVGGNSQLQGKIFEINSRDSVHQFTETTSNSRLRGSRVYTWWRHKMYDREF